MKSSFPLLLTLALSVGLTACGGDDDNKSASSSSAASSSLASSSSDVSSSASDASSSSSSVEATPEKISLSYIGRYSTSEFGVSAAEIPVFDPASKRAFIVNAQLGKIDVLDMREPSAPAKVGDLDATAVAAGAIVNSVAVHDGIVAVAIQAAVKTDTGYVGFYHASDLSHISDVAVGALPDMLTFTPDGMHVLVANEGEPNDTYSVDPEGSVSVIDISDINNPVAATADFHSYNGKEAELRAAGVRIYGPDASAAMDFEPEYIAVSADSTTAWATLQENNALAKIDIATAKVTEVVPLGYKDYGLTNNKMDVSDKDDMINIKNWAGVYGMYQPDAIYAYESADKTYLVTANEGDSRAWGEDDDAYWEGDASKGFVEESRVKDLVKNGAFKDAPPQLLALASGALLNPDVFGYCGAAAGDSGDCRDDEMLGRLTVTWTLGYRMDETGAPVMFDSTGTQDAAGTFVMYDKLYSLGGRSFAIWDEDGALVWDSADQFEQYFASDACMLGSERNIPCAEFFNSGHDEGDAFDSRSDAKGPEPEGVAIGHIGSKVFAFIGLERMGGVMVYDITEPAAPVFMDYLNSREDWTTEEPDTVLATAGDLGPEGLTFVSAANSPNGKPLIIVGNEISGSTSVYEIKATFAAE